MASNNLSEIAKDNSWQFNDLQSDISASNPRVKLANLKAELAFNKINLDRASSQQEKAFLQKAIDSNQADINNLGNISDAQAAKSTNKSLFDANAYLDYARNYQTSTRWVDNKKDLSNTSIFVVNNKDFDMNRPVTGDPDSILDNKGLTVEELIKWSETYPALQLRYQDFVFCKNLGLYPNNRLIILRRFKHGAPDNLFDYYRDKEYADNAGRPLSTMITWVKPEKDVFKMNFKEGWVPGTKGDFFSSLNKKADPENPDGFFKFSLYNLSENSMFFALLSSLEGDGQKGNTIDGSTSNFAIGKDKVGNFLNEPGGNPNLIRNSAMRTAGGERSLASDIDFDLEFEFQMRYMQGVDPGVVMLDLISNCARMGTSVAQFRFDVEYLQSETIQRIINGDYEVEIQGLFSRMTDSVGNITTAFTELLTGIGTKLQETAKGLFDKDVAAGVLTQTSQMILSRYRENIKQALSAETGLPSGVWHITIGNPKNPIISCGDMVITNSTLTLGKDLGYNDFPNTFTYSIQLSSARERGRNEIERIFNAGRGRVYVYQNPTDNPDYHLLKTK